MKLLLLFAFFVTALQLDAASKKPEPVSDTVKAAPESKAAGKDQESPAAKDKRQKQNTQLHKSSLRSQPINPNSEIARVKRQLQEIRMSPISKEDKIQKQRMLLDHEIANAKGKLREVDSAAADEKKDHAKHLRDAIVDFLQKLSSINPQLK